MRPCGVIILTCGWAVMTLAAAAGCCKRMVPAVGVPDWDTMGKMVGEEGRAVAAVAVEGPGGLSTIRGLPVGCCMSIGLLVWPVVPTNWPKLLMSKG